MQRNKFLLWILTIVIIVNIFYYVVYPIFNIQEIIAGKATEYIKENYGLDVNYTSFNINENQVNISKIQFTKDHKLKVNIDELILNYSLSKTIFKKKPIVNSIRIYNPKVKLIIDSLKSNGSKTKIPDLKEYFNKLYISDGEIDVKFISDQLSIEETIDSINVEVVNSISSKINMSAKIEDSYLDFEGMIVKNQLRYILNVENYSLKNIKSENAQDLSGLVNFNIFNDENIDNLELSGSNIHFKFNDNEFTFLDFEVDGNREKLMFNSQNCIADGNKCNVSANLFLQDTPQKFNANVLIPNLAISKYLPKVSGKLWSDITLQGNFEDLTIQSNLKSDSLLFFGQKLTEFRGVANYSNDVITFDFKHFKYLENKIKTNGFYNFEDGRLEAKSSSTKFRYSANSINFCGEIDVDYKLLNSKNNFYCNIRKAKIYNKHLIFDNLDGFATLNDGVYQINIDYADENFTFEASGNLDENYAKAQVNSTRFPPSKILKQVVSNNILFSTNIDISYKNDSLKTEGALRLYDKQFGKLDGNYNFCVNTNLKKKFTKFRFDSDFGVFNYEPFQIDFSGFADSTYLYTEEFTINNDIELDCEYNFKKSKLLTNVKGKEIDYINYLAYFMNKTEASFYDGKCDFDISYNSSDKGIFDGNIDFYDFKSDKDNELEVNLKLLGDNKKIRLVDSKIANKYHEQISLQGYYEFTKKEILFVANIQDIDSKNFLGNSINVNGFIKNAQMYFQSKDNVKSLNFHSKIRNANFNNIKLDTLDINFIKKDKEFILNKFYFNNRDYRFYSNGNLGYNFFDLQTFSNEDNLNFDFKGDLFKLIKPLVIVIDKAKSECNFSGKIGIKDDKIAIGNTKFRLNKSEIELFDKANKFEDINISFDINQNILDINNINFHSGDGKFLFDNEITDSANDLKIGMLNIGELKFRTTKKGLLIHFPSYQSSKSMVDFRIRGRDSKFFKIVGPIDNPTFIGNIEIANGNFVYPADSDNLFKWIENKEKTEKSDRNENQFDNLSFNLDVLFEIGENIRYQTYPLDILIKDKSFVELKYYDKNWDVSEAKITSEDGDLELFGTNFKVDFIDLSVSTSQNNLSLYGRFLKKTSDGSLINLEITSRDAKEDQLFGGLKFDLSSDNPNDTSFESIMVKARYNKQLEDFISGEDNNIIEDELLNLAELGIDNTIINPFISPIESKLRRYLKLDYFSLKSGLIKNVYNRYKEDESETELEQRDMTNAQDFLEFGTSVFLNNLTIKTGKSLTDNLFLDYKIKLEKGTNIEVIELIYYQNISFRYNLPRKYRVNLSYNIAPFVKNSFSIMLEKSFSF